MFLCMYLATIIFLNMEPDIQVFHPVDKDCLLSIAVSALFPFVLIFLIEAKLKMSQSEVRITADLWVDDVDMIYQGFHLNQGYVCRSNIYCEHLW